MRREYGEGMKYSYIRKKEKALEERETFGDSDINNRRWSILPLKVLNSNPTVHPLPTPPHPPTAQ